jgi:hypothetical protein
MAHPAHMATPADDERHRPGPGALPLWNESYWFPFYDPASRIGVVLRVGMLPNLGTANLFLFLAHEGRLVCSLVDQAAPCPAYDARRFAASGLEIEIEEPRERFRLRFAHGAHAFDLDWRGTGPTRMYPIPPDTTAEQYPRHLEQAGRVTGTVTLNGVRHALDAIGHRDHSWGGERDWTKFYGWTVVIADFAPDFWVHAVRFTVMPDAPDFHIGSVWNGREFVHAADVRLALSTSDGGTRQTGVDLTLTDERGAVTRVSSDEVLFNCPVPYGRTWLKDAMMRYRSGDRVGYGILEHGYQEKD